MTITEQIARLLDELGLGSYGADGTGGLEGSIYHNALPADPDRAMAVARYPGAESDSFNPWDEINVQVRCRGPAGEDTAEADAQAVYDHLHGLGMRLLPGGTWLQLAVGNQAGPIFVGRDANERPEWTVNFRMELLNPTMNRPL